MESSTPSKSHTESKPIILSLRLRRIIVPFAVSLLVIIFFEQAMLQVPFTLDKQIETALGILALYCAASIPTLPIDIGSKE